MHDFSGCAPSWWQMQRLLAGQWICLFLPMFLPMSLSILLWHVAMWHFERVLVNHVTLCLVVIVSPSATFHNANCLSVVKNCRSFRKFAIILANVDVLTMNFSLDVYVASQARMSCINPLICRVWPIKVMSVWPSPCLLSASLYCKDCLAFDHHRRYFGLKAEALWPPLAAREGTWGSHSLFLSRGQPSTHQ